MKSNDPKLEELQQRSHDYAIWYIDTIFGTIAGFCLLGGLAAIALGVVTTEFNFFSFGCLSIIGGSLLFVLLAILRTLKDIRFNSRHLLRLQSNEASSSSDGEA